MADERGGNETTVAAYEQRAGQYLAHAPATPSPLVAALTAVLPQGSSVLEIGSGPGRDATALEQAGLHVDRTDATAAFVDRLTQQGFHARLLNALTDDLGGPYDAIFASAVLLHFTEPELRQVLRASLAAVAEGGILAASLKAGEGEEWSTEKLDAPRYFKFWSADTLPGVLESTGWRVMTLSSNVAADGQRWLVAIAQRPSP